MATQATNDPTAPITPARFAAALKDLPLASLHLKVLELRNALLHLAHSNAQLRPFADGTETTLDLAPGTPDPDCVDAIRENEAVMARMRTRIELVKAEVVGRGVSWREFEAAGDDEADEPGVVGAPPAGAAATEGGSRPLTNGVHDNHNDDEATDAANNSTNGTTTASSPRATPSTTTAGNPWTDGTFQMGTIRNGELHMDAAAPPQRPNGASSATSNSNANDTATSSTATPQNGSGGGGRLTDDELRRLLELRLAEDAGEDEEDGGLHL